MAKKIIMRDCAHGAAPKRCREICANNPRMSPTYKKANLALKSGKATYSEWIEYANVFDSDFQFEKAEACTRLALLSLGGSRSLSSNLSSAVGNFLKFDLKSKNLVGVHPLRLRAALEEAKESLYGVYGELDERTKKLALAEFKRNRLSLDEAIRQTSYSGPEAMAKVAKFFRSRGLFSSDKLGLPEVALDLYLRALQLEPNDPVLLIGIAAVYNDLNRWPEAIEACEKALEIEGSKKWAYPTLCKALMYSGNSLRAWDLLQELPITKDSKNSVLAQKVICLFRMEVDCNWDEGDLKQISWLRGVLAEEMKEWEGSTQNPRSLQHAVLNSFIDSIQLGAAWAYLDELQSENWGGNLKYWREKIIASAESNGVNLNYSIESESPKIADAFPDSND